MIAAISLMRRRADVDLATFRRHWLDIHGPLVCAFVGLRHYVQDHVIESPVMNEAARDLRIDGFPILIFDNDADRQRAHGSPEMAACNVDSRSFIGAVSRVMCESRIVIPTTPDAAAIKLIVLFPGDTPDDATVDRYAADAQSLAGLRGLTLYRALQQGAAPNSTIPHLPVSVAGIAELSFASLVDLECAVATRAAEQREARFVVEQHRLV
jgi:uncharacterized protein (TIGR02118 family)